MRFMVLRQKYVFVVEEPSALCVVTIDDLSWVLWSKAGGRLLISTLSSASAIAEIERKRLEIFVETSEMGDVYAATPEQDVRDGDCYAEYLYPTGNPAVLRRCGSRVADALGKTWVALDNRFVFWFWQCALESQSEAWQTRGATTLLDDATQLMLFERFSSRNDVSESIHISETCIVRGVKSLRRRELIKLDARLLEGLSGLGRTDRMEIIGLIEREELGGSLTGQERLMRIRLLRQAVTGLSPDRQEWFWTTVHAVICRGVEAMLARGHLRLLH